MLAQKDHKFSYKVWIEDNGKPVLGRGGAEILEQVEEKKSISLAARKLGMSYRYVWNYLQKIGKAVGEPVVETFRGGKSGGGGAELTPHGKSLLSEYKRLEAYLGEVLGERSTTEVKRLNISARNRLKGKVASVEKDGLMAKVKVEITVPATVTAMISKEAAEDLGLKVGDKVEAIVKATEVMIAK
ncbi:MAG TPA: TOBE domain-containing protein [candidate division Zixibacteria bacterium]|nr:TOBE domain-containing protein [candidate division Zixibacteria bacterium]